MPSSDSGIPALGPHIAKIAASAFGGRPSVRQYYDEDESSTAPILSCAGAPRPGWTTFSTVSLHEYPNLLDGDDVRVELAGVVETDETEFGNVLASAAFCVMKDHWLAAPGVVFPGVIAEYCPSTTVPHIMWIEPFPWSQLSTVRLAHDFSVHWLLVMPITDDEYAFLKHSGFEILEALFDESATEYFDLSRSSVV